MAIDEVWKDVGGYEGLYQVSNLGRIRRLLFVNNVCVKPKETIVTPSVKDNDYLYISLHKNGYRKNKYVHRLVAEAFLPNPNNHPVVNHIDYDVTNNSVDNLEWCSQKHNAIHSAKHMRKPKSRCKSSNTGEKYISFCRNKYRVCIVNSRFNSEKQFSNLEDAIAYRNEVMKDDGNTM